MKITDVQDLGDVMINQLTDLFVEKKTLLKLVLETGFSAKSLICLIEVEKVSALSKLLIILPLNHQKLELPKVFLLHRKL